MEFKDRIIGNYPELFDKGDGGGIDHSAEGNFVAKWGWFQSLYALSDGNVERIENITELLAHRCFMMLAFKKDKNELENQRLKRNG